MLYIVSTPIGNLDDISIRQAKTLINSDIILAEDTRSAQTLLEGIKNRFSESITKAKIWSYFKEKEFEKLPEIISLLKEGKNIAIISDAGTPLISDPGYLLVSTAVKQKLPFTVIPGPSAIISALVLAGINPNPKHGGFTFFGFFPKKENEIIQIISRLKKIKEIFPEMAFVFYESPHRLSETLKIMIKTGWNPDIFVCREMTKVFEEVIRGKASELVNNQYKGEITVVLK